MAVLSTRSGQVARSLNSGRDRFHTVPYKEVISGQAEPFLSRACRMATLSGPASRSGRLKAGQPMAVLSRMAAVSRLRTRPVAAMAVLSIRSVQMARSVDLGCGWSISYYPAQAVYQRQGRAFLERAGNRPAAMAALSKPASSKASYKLLTKLLLNFLLKLLVKRLVLFCFLCSSL